MNEIPKRPMTADEVLACFSFQHRNWRCDGLKPPDLAPLTAQTSVAEWRRTDDLLDWRELGEALNEGFAVTLTTSEWQNVLVPESEKTLGGVCELMATQAEMIDFGGSLGADRPASPKEVLGILGKLLARYDVDVRDMDPSRPLMPYLCDCFPKFLLELAQALPHAMPDVTIRNRPCEILERALLLVTAFGLFAILGAFVLCSVGALNLGIGLVITGMLVGLWLILWAGTSRAGKATKPTSVQIGELNTLGDLVELIRHREPPGEDTGKE